MAWQESVQESSGFAVVISRAHIAPTTATWRTEGRGWRRETAGLMMDARDRSPRAGRQSTNPGTGMAVKASRRWRHGPTGFQRFFPSQVRSIAAAMQ